MADLGGRRGTGCPHNQLDLNESFPEETEMVNALPLGGYKQLIEDAARSLTIHLNQPVRQESNMVTVGFV